MNPAVSVLLPTHNPHVARWHRTLAGLAGQTLPATDWELIVVDNASHPPVALSSPTPLARIVPEAQLGLTHARVRGLREARGDLCVFVDDDNVLASDYLAQVVRIFAAAPRLGAAGGRSLPEFEQPPRAWQQEFLDLLALRDPGPAPLVCTQLRSAGATRNEYPRCAPIGAGMALRREAGLRWADAANRLLLDRRGRELTSGGDNDIVFSVLEGGWHIGYFPELNLTHLIPAQRLETDYLARLNRSMQKSWVQVLASHDANPWPPIPPWTTGIRCLKSWWATRAWSSPAAYVRWQGHCGRFEGQATAARTAR